MNGTMNINFVRCHQYMWIINMEVIYLEFSVDPIFLENFWTPILDISQSS